jgi:HEAT repeat protein
MEALIAKISPQTSPEVCLEVIAEASGLSSPRLPHLISLLLTHPDSEVRARALVELEGIADPAVRALVEAGLRDDNVDVRLQALEVIDRGGVPDPEDLVSGALRDSDPNVRQLGLQAGLSLPALKRQEILMEAASSPHSDVALSALSMMDSQPDKRNVPAFIEALGHAVPEVREQARETLAFTFHEFFDSPAAGRAWWSANQGRYSPQLVEEIPPAEGSSSAAP